MKISLITVNQKECFKCRVCVINCPRCILDLEEKAPIKVV